SRSRPRRGAPSSAADEAVDAARDEREPPDRVEPEPREAERNAALAGGRAPAHRAGARDVQREQRGPERDAPPAAGLAARARLADAAAEHVQDEVAVRLDPGVVDDRLRHVRERVPGRADAEREVGVLAARMAERLVETVRLLEHL